ncbi:hypothetical protein [Duganella sp. BuS-21]|uniref:hypothetical protein n=1 Tax=Duganella sp. BuS-21 TaxID=2943848 RepID=UPI0035A71AE5
MALFVVKKGIKPCKDSAGTAKAGGKETPFNGHQGGQLGDRAWEEQRGGGTVIGIVSAEVPAQLAADFFRHGGRTAARLTLSLVHIGPHLLLGWLQTGDHGRTP